MTMRSIKRPSSFEPIVRLLAETNHPKGGKSIFPTMRELLCFAAVLGFSAGEKRPLTGPTNEIDGRIFENSDQALDLIYLIALADARNADILQPTSEEAMLQVFEEYAAAGLSVLGDWLKERPEDTYGDEAIFAALRKRGYLANQPHHSPVDVGDVKF